MTDSKDKNNHKPDEQEAVPTAAYGGAALGPGAQIGPYKLLSILGEGGFAMVYLAEQERPVKRRVALKVIKPGMDTKQVIARFEAERQALALLDHPCIATVFDAGTTEVGRPYFVMEYVKGVPITEHCDKEKLSIEARLELFEQVCEGVQHAHQKGIIHRDIKPSNTLVSIEGEKAVPKIIDFGVAKAITQPLTERTLYTEQGQFVGTPEYMSPEQAEMGAQDVDTRSDVYSLGVLLYELLTGALPFDTKTLREGGVDHIRQIIREDDPKTPSTRLTGLGEEAKRVAERRRTEVSTLARRLHRELEWIPLKAMRKERARRYRSPSELADDIRNYLDGAPLIAGPESTMYRVRKSVQRNRALVMGLAAVLAVVAVGAVVSTVFAVRAKRQAMISQAVADFLTQDLLGLVDPDKAKSQDVSIRYILDGASENLQGKFKDEPIVEASIRKTLGDTYMKLGEWKLAQPHFESVLETYRKHLGESDPSTLAVMDILALLYSAQTLFNKAEQLNVKALEIRRREHGQENPLTLGSMLQLGQLYVFQGNFGQAEPLLKKSLEISRRCLGKAHTQTVASMCGLSNLYYLQGQTDKATELLVQVLEIQERSGRGEEEETLLLMSNVALRHFMQGRHKEAETMAAEAFGTCRRVLGDEHGVTLQAMSTLGRLYQRQGRYDEADQLLTEALDTSRRVLGEAYPLTNQLMQHLGDLYKDQGRYEDAEPLLLEHEMTTRRAWGQQHLMTQISMSRLIGLYEAWGKPDEAAKWRAKLPQPGDVIEPN